jgi:hypothetical protein
VGASARIASNKDVVKADRLPFLVMAPQSVVAVFFAATAAGVADDLFLLVVAARAGIRASIEAAVRAIVADAEIDRTATPRKELRRHQHQNEQRLGHERRFRKSSRFP